VLAPKVFGPQSGYWTGSLRKNLESRLAADISSYKRQEVFIQPQGCEFFMIWFVVQTPKTSTSYLRTPLAFGPVTKSPHETRFMMHFRLKDSVKRQMVSASLHHPALQGSEPIESPGVRRKAVEEASDCVEMPEKCRPRQCLDCFYDKKLPHSARIYTY
jgi:hypothetical protein